jgi:hypothetical protein
MPPAAQIRVKPVHYTKMHSWAAYVTYDILVIVGGSDLSGKKKLETIRYSEQIACCENYYWGEAPRQGARLSCLY